MNKTAKELLEEVRSLKKQASSASKAEERKIRECLNNYGFTEHVVIWKRQWYKDKRVPYWLVSGVRKDNIMFEYEGEYGSVKDICKMIDDYAERYNLKEVRSIKKASRMPQWYYALWEHVSYGSNRGDDPFGGEETADYITDQSQYVAKYFAQVMKQNGINIKMDNYPLDDGNSTDIKYVWGGQADNSGMIAWGFFSNDDRPYVMFEKKIGGEWAHYFEHGPKYKDGDPIKQIRNAKKWLLGSIAGLDTEILTVASKRT